MKFSSTRKLYIDLQRVVIEVYVSVYACQNVFVFQVQQMAACEKEGCYNTNLLFVFLLL